MGTEPGHRMLRWAYLPECQAPPRGWHVGALTDIATVIAGQSPPSETYNDKADGLPFLQGNGDFSWVSPVPRLWCTAAAKVAKTGDSLISVRAPVGELNRADQDYAIGRGLAAIRAKEGCDPHFLHHALQRWRWCLQRVAQGTTFDAVTARHFTQLSVCVPRDPDEQAAIARILDAADTALERARSAVERARELRRGLLQASFEFVGSTEPTKDTDAGRIPRTWDAIKGREAFVVVTGGCSSVDALRRPRDNSTPDSWFMKVDDFNDPANQRTIVRTKIGFCADENRLFKVLPVGTVVIAKRGAAIMKNRVRATSVPVSLDPNLMALQVLPGMRPDFLRLQLEWRNLSRYVESSGIPQLNNKDLYPRYFLRAPDERQREVIKLLAAAEKLEDAHIVKSDALEQLKKSLMHDLLTGRVRVNHAKVAAS